MKKTFKTMLALMAGAMTFTGCTSDILENTPQQASLLKPMTFTATQEGDATRAAIVGTAINWTEGDQISIFDGATENDGNQEFTLTGEAGSTSGTFEGSAATASTYYALYPYASSTESRVPTLEEAEAAGSSSAQLSTWKEKLSSAGMMQSFQETQIKTQMEVAGISAENQAIILAYLKGEPITIKSGPQRNESDQFENVDLPAVQTATAGSADPKAMLMIAKSEDANTLKFKNVCAYVKVTPQFDCTSIVFCSNGTESLAGTVTLGLDTDGVPTTTVTAGTNTVTLSGTITANNTYYIAVLPATLANGFTIIFYTADGKYKKSAKKSVPVPFTRSEVLNLGELEISDLKPAPTTGTAKATIGGESVNVNWVQLWENGPKFAEYNVGATSASEMGNVMVFADASKTGADYVWGANWRTPSKDEMNELYLAATGENAKVTYEYVNGEGYKFTGKQDGYTSNFVFFPAESSGYSDVYGNYWTGTADGSQGWYMHINADYNEYQFYLSSTFPSHVRAVLNE